MEVGMSDMALKDCLVDTFLKHKEKKAVSFLRRGRVATEITYHELHRDSNRVANKFREMGVTKGDRVILYFPKCLFFVVAHIALQKIGAVAVPLNPGFKRSEMAYFVDDAGPRLVLAGVEQEPMLKEVDSASQILVIDAQERYQELDFFRDYPDEIGDVKIGPDDPGLIIYTSGTTGKPKGAVLTQRNLVHDAGNVIQIWQISASDVLCHALPLFHVHGLCFALHTCLIAGGHSVTLDQFASQTVVELLADKERYGCTVFMAVPAMYGKMLEYAAGRNLDFAHVRLWTSGSAPLLPKDFVRIREVFGKEPVEREGMSETGMNFSNPISGVRKPGSIGLPLPELEVRIVDPETFQDLPPGQEGEIWLKGPGITPGYWQKPEETAKTFEKGWFRTGDLGKIDKDGFYYLTDRIKHIIISGGENISPKEIEGIVNQLDEVKESSVVGIADEKWGERIVAAVVVRPGADLAPVDVKEHCKRHLHDWKCPKEVVFVEELPKNTMGKVLKEEVKGFFQD
jgi:malonyl-CoA/methylmalonyl-CoA synthetase